MIQLNTLHFLFSLLCESFETFQYNTCENEIIALIGLDAAVSFPVCLYLQLHNLFRLLAHGRIQATLTHSLRVLVKAGLADDDLFGSEHFL